MTDTTHRRARSLEKLSKLLFDRAVAARYSALLIEISSGLIAVFVAINDLKQEATFWLAVLGCFLLFVAYGLKIYFSRTYENAETMRRQAVLANGLGWRINKTQFSEWKRLAGESIIQKLENERLDEGYYDTEQEQGAKRLLEMTQESAFWTRHLCRSIKKYLWVIFAISIVLSFIVLTLTASPTLGTPLSLQVAYVVYLLMPLVLTFDTLGWAIQLNATANSIEDIEKDLERLSQKSDVELTDVLRLVYEYNCQLVKGFPIPNWFFNVKHDYIEDLWQQRFGQ